MHGYYFQTSGGKNERRKKLSVNPKEGKKGMEVREKWSREKVHNKHHANKKVTIKKLQDFNYLIKD